EVGRHPENGEAILAQNGRYGPYLTWGKETRSLESDEQIFSVTLDEALALLAQPKARGRRAAAGPLRELGEDPVTKRPVVVRSGRFGVYVTDGEANATLRLGDAVETITLDRACELLAERRNAEPSTRPRAAKKAPARKTPAKKAAKKTAKATPTATKRATKKASTAATSARVSSVKTSATRAAKEAGTARGKSANAALIAASEGSES
ncbi:MAG TPA: topoisomerase C-terminal repeat-containing protein, partial [Acidimicrobiales bacterium]|nr:topoisomerase C-terminal repeat-containing protein [Acidimicrobiales bacterium]